MRFWSIRFDYLRSFASLADILESCFTTRDDSTTSSASGTVINNNENYMLTINLSADQPSPLEYAFNDTDIGAATVTEAIPPAATESVNTGGTNLVSSDQASQ
jgi:hypothetical protein